MRTLGKRFSKGLFKHNEKSMISLQEDITRPCNVLNLCSGLSSAFGIHEEEVFEVVLVARHLLKLFPGPNGHGIFTLENETTLLFLARVEQIFKVFRAGWLWKTFHFALGL